MDTTEVWSTIFCWYSSVKRMEMQIRLSRNADLYVQFKQLVKASSAFKYLDAFTFVLRHMDRIAELHIEVLRKLERKYQLRRKFWEERCV